MYAKQARLQAYQYFGQAGFPPLTQMVDATAIRGAMKRAGAFKNLRLYSDRDLDSQSGATIAGAIGPTHYLTWDATYNSASRWAVAVGSSGYLTDAPQGFSNNVNALYHVRSVLNTPSAYTGFPILSNQPWCIHLFLFKPPSDQPKHIFKLRWGRYQLQAIDGSWEIMRLAQANTDPATGESQAGWSQSQEDALDALLNQSTISSTDEATIAAYRKNIYSDYQSLSLESQLENAYGKYFTLTFIPLPHGRLMVLSGESVAFVGNTEILATRSNGVLWPDAFIRIEANSGAYLWQVGKPQFAYAGQLRLGWINTQRHSLAHISSVIYTSITDLLPGTSITPSYEYGNGYWLEFIVDFQANGSYAPFLYALAAQVLGADRDGDDTSTGTLAWDTDDHLQTAVDPPIRDIRPEYEGMNRRLQCTVEMNGLKGSILTGITTAGLSGTDHLKHEWLEHRILKLQANNTNILNNGLIYAAVASNLAQSTESAARSAAERNETYVTYTCGDGWAILEEDLMDEVVIGDYAHVGDVIYQVLKNGGWKDSELAAVSRTFGQVIEGAVAGETWAVMSQQDASRADFIREILDQFGYGAYLYQNPATGEWALTDPPSTTRSLTIGGTPHTVAFHTGEGSDPAHSSTTYPGRFTILSPLDWHRTPENFYNIIRVQGDINPATGLPFYADWWINGSIGIVSGNRAKTHIGRRKRMRTVKNTALRSDAAVQKVLRSLITTYGLPPRFHAFMTYFTPGLYPGDRVTVNGIACRVESIADASLRDDKMSLVCREVN